MNWNLKKPIALALAVATTEANACAFDMIGLGGLDIVHPGSLSVAISVSEARAAGLLPDTDPVQAGRKLMFAPLPSKQGASKTALDGQMSLMFASHRLREFGKRLSEDIGQAAPDFSLVLVSSRLWTEFAMIGQRYETNVHVEGPVDGKPVVVTDLLVIDAILNGSISIEYARENGLLDVQDDTGDRVAALIERALKQA